MADKTLSESNHGTVNAPGSNGKRADGWANSDAPSIGWLPNIPTSGPGVNVGPGTKAWSAERKGPYTTGMQRNGKPKR
jgi:hypothetical protein